MFAVFFEVALALALAISIDSFVEVVREHLSPLAHFVVDGLIISNLGSQLNEAHLFVGIVCLRLKCPLHWEEHRGAERDVPISVNDIHIAGRNAVFLNLLLEIGIEMELVASAVLLHEEDYGGDS